MSAMICLIDRSPRRRKRRRGGRLAKTRAFWGGSRVPTMHRSLTVPFALSLPFALAPLRPSGAGLDMSIPKAEKARSLPLMLFGMKGLKCGLGAERLATRFLSCGPPLALFVETGDR